jgi:hypothetical protein
MAEEKEKHGKRLFKEIVSRDEFFFLKALKLETVHFE